MSNLTQRGATGPLALQAGGVFPVSNDTNLQSLVGTRWDTEDGREVIFVSVGATAVASSGVLCQDAAIIAAHQGLTVTAVQAYSANGNVPPTVTVTLGATALAASQYQGGFLIVDSGPGIGQTLVISNNPAALASATGVVITLEDSPNVPLTTASTVCLIPAHGSSVILNPTTQTNVPVGVTLYPLAAGTTAIPGTSYAFLTSKGLTAVLSDVSAPGAGAQVTASATTAGAIAGSTGTGATFVGIAAQAGVSAKSRAVFVDL
jgi:hypothetical protein